ncbi:MAG: nucleotidyltransferase domain-containing protein [Coriobacteriales bacterium]|jgi:predicted nucleotidyltransferase|nr:nucleotidyltransferase domain-containing protein [Coriobacteriales bacterium]
MVTIKRIREAAGQIAPGYGICEVKLFGSYATDSAGRDSDVDLLVAYGENPVSLFKVFGFKEEMSHALGTEVDVLKYPLENIVYPDFELGETVDIYED